jgi:RNA polymerase sigma-70 factor (ECF subfamily)
VDNQSVEPIVAGNNGPAVPNMVEKELQQLIDGCKNQDRQSQEILYKRLYGFAMKICLRCTDNQSEASEVLNEGFFKAFTNIEKYDPKWPFKAWLGKIMYHASIDYYRANLKWANMEKLEKSDYPVNEAVVERKLEYEDLLAIVQQLPPAYRIVFNLYAIDGYSHEEIAQMVGISAGTSRSNLHKARQKLQQMLTVAQSIIVLLLLKYKARFDKTEGYQ